MKVVVLQGSHMAAQSELATWCAGENWCPITATAKIVGRKWHPVILYHLLENGALGFNELMANIEDISSKVLSDSLEDLEHHDVVNRTMVSERPYRVEYSLTEAGQSLEPVLDAMDEWGESYLDEDESRERIRATPIDS